MPALPGQGPASEGSAGGRGDTHHGCVLAGNYKYKYKYNYKHKHKVSLQAILAKARQGGSFGDLLPDMVWEEKNVVKREKLEEEDAEEREAKKRIKTNDDGGDIKAITLDDVMFEEELYDRFSDEEDEHEETEKEINEQVLENKGDAEASIVDSSQKPAPRAPFLLFSTLNSEPQGLSEDEDTNNGTSNAVAEKSNVVHENPMKAVVKLRMTSVKEGMMVKVEEEEVEKEMEEERRARSTSPWMASKLHPLLSV